MSWRIRWWLANRLESLARRVRPQIPETPTEYAMRSPWWGASEMPAGPNLDDVLAKLTREAS